MRFWIVLSLLCVICAPAFAQHDKKTDDLKPADPDTGESTGEERALGLLPNSFEKQGVKFAITYIGEVLGNPTGGARQSTVYEDRIIFAVDADLEKLSSISSRLVFMTTPSRSTGRPKVAFVFLRMMRRFVFEPQTIRSRSDDLEAVLDSTGAWQFLHKDGTAYDE